MNTVLMKLKVGIYSVYYNLLLLLLFNNLSLQMHLLILLLLFNNLSLQMHLLIL